MISSLVGTLRWTLSLGAKFARVVPFFTLCIIGLTLVSQIAMLVASLLPLKVLILLGSDHVPGYFPGFLVVYGHDVLIALLSGMTFGIFLAHLLVEKLITWLTATATTRLMAMSQKMTLFERQEEIAREAYLRFSRALASSVFVLSALAGLGFFYPSMVLLQLGYILAGLGVLWLLQHVDVSFRERLETQPAPILSLLAGIGFFVVFAYLVVDFIFLSPPGALVAIISLLLARQIMGRASGIVVDFYLLQRQRVKLDALFFHGKVLMPQLPDAGKGIWALLQPAMRRDWVGSVLSDLSLISDNSFSCHWLQLGQRNVAGVRVEHGANCFLLKLFEVNRGMVAAHELALLGEGLDRLPGFKLLGATQLEKRHCLVYALPDGAPLDPKRYKAALLKLRTELLTVTPTAALVGQYQRSKPMLWQRLTSELLERLSVAIDSPEQKTLFDNFLLQLPAVQQALRSLPLVLLNPEMAADAIWSVSDERNLLMNWGQWSIEPLGAGWPETAPELEQLKNVLLEASAQRKELANVHVAHAELAALAFALERECNRQRFAQALGLVPGILERLDTIEQ